MIPVLTVPRQRFQGIEKDRQPINNRHYAPSDEQKMPQIFIAPAENPRDTTDLDRSIGNAIERQVIIESFSDATYPELIDIERRGRGFYAWGLRPAPENIQRWFQMGIGDFVLISYKNAYRHYAKVLGRYENSRAAQAVWGQQDCREEIREFIFFLSEPITLKLPCDELSDYLTPTQGSLQQVPEEAIDRIEADFGTVERFFRRRLLNTGAGGPILDMSGIIRLSEREQARLRSFDPQSSKAARARVVENIIQRRGEPRFRAALLTAYAHNCAVTSCNAPDALEATYIIPYRGKYTHHPSNGILLRADLHTLFDLGKLAVDTRTMTVVLADELLDTSYKILAGRPLRYPDDEPQRPSTEALDLHRRLAGL
jgi:hypothetical protein